MGKKNIIPILLIGFIILSVIGVSFEASLYQICKKDFDALNAASVLFSGLAFVAVTGTLLYQYKQIKSQQEQFVQQNFETNLFKMLETQRAIMTHILDMDKNIFDKAREDIILLYNYKTLAVTDGDWYKIGQLINKDYFLRRCLEQGIHKELYEDLHEGDSNEQKYIEVIKKIKENYDNKEIPNQGWATFSYRIVSDKYLYKYDHFCGHLFKILQYIQKTENENNKNYKDYADIVQSQMSASELFVLFYNGLAYPKMHQILIDFDFLRNFIIYTPEGKILEKEAEKFYRIKIEHKPNEN